MIYDIFNCNWVATRRQLFSTHIHTNNTGKVTKQTIHRTQKYIEQHKKYTEQHNNTGSERLCSTYNGLFKALERFRVENIRHTEESLVGSCETVGRKLHYYLALGSEPLRHNDVTASPISFIPLETDKISKTSCPALGANFIVRWEGSASSYNPLIPA